MASVICNKCAKEITSDADICPHCGNPIKSTVSDTYPPEKPRQVANAVTMLWIVIAIAPLRIIMEWSRISRMASPGFTAFGALAILAIEVFLYGRSLKVGIGPE